MPRVVDSRRLTGPNVLWARPAAILDLALEPGEATAAVEAWRDEGRRILDAVGWRDEQLAYRTFPSGLSLALSAPIDTLYAATEVNEWAWESAAARLDGHAAPDLASAAERLRRLIAKEAKPRLRHLQAEACRRGLTLLADDERVSIGTGRGARSWPLAELPSAEQVAWDELGEVPVALVTGTNGKTTTVRLLAAMAAAAGRTPGSSSTDGVQIGEELVERGDYSGPEGARGVLRDRRVEVAILETARGGLLRRGLAVSRAEVAVVTNLAEDHLCDFGIGSLDALAAIKLVPVRVARRAVLNADDPQLVERLGRRRELARPVTWFGLGPTPLEATHRHGAPLPTCTVDREGWLIVAGREAPRRLLRSEEVPIALGGAARHNLLNALAAAAAAIELGLAPEVVRETLGSFGAAAADNPGRLNEYRLGGVRAFVDFAHNPHGLAALLDMANGLVAERRLVVLGQAGDRGDEELRELARAVWSRSPDRVILKHLDHYRRGREEGEVRGILEAELRRAGAREDDLCRVDSEEEAVREALAWARPGDLLLLLVHEDRQPVLELLDALERRGWRPGEALPRHHRQG